jgi:hypothetical protein
MARGLADQPPAGAPAVVAAGGAPGDDREGRHRRREAMELGALLGAAPVLRAPMRVSRATPAAGELITLNVESGCRTAPVPATGRVTAVGAHVVVVSDTLSPAEGLGAADWAAIAAAFDTLVHPVLTEHFGPATDVDGNGRIIAFYTPAVNRATPPGASSYLGGLMHSRDVLPRSLCPASNQAEAAFMLVPDPTGSVNGHVRTVDLVRRQTVGVLAHELQHLINAGSRAYRPEGAAPPERPWLNEGLSHVAEELVFYRAAMRAPRANLGPESFDADGLELLIRYQGNNFLRLRDWMTDPRAAGIEGTSTAGRGASWSFLRYVADRRGGEAGFWKALVQTRDTGWVNLEAATGEALSQWRRDWAIALWADDHVAGVGRDFTHPSWRVRELYPSGYPLSPALLHDGVPQVVTMASATSVYFRLRVAAGRAARVAVSGDRPVHLMRTR